MKLEDLKTLCAAATPEPWSETAIYSAIRYFRKTGPDIADLGGDAGSKRCPYPEDSAFITAARTALPLLIAVAEAAKELVRLRPDGHWLLDDIRLAVTELEKA